MKKRNLLIFVLAATAIGATSCGSTEEVNPSINITCAGNVTKLSLGETLQFTAKIEPENFEQKVEWSVVEITGEADISESGLLTPSKVGTIEVVAASYVDKSIKTSYPLKIEEAKTIAPTVISATISEAEINVGKSANINFTVTPENASKEVIYKSLNEEVATVSKAGVVKGIAKGETTIEVISKVAPTVKGTVNIKVNEEVIEETIDWSKVEVSTHAQYMEAASDTKIKVEGVCKAVFPANEEGSYQAYLMNEKGGFYLYGLRASQKVELNKVYEVCGTKALHQNCHEIKSIEKVTVLEKSINAVETDISDRDPSDVKNFSDVMGGLVKGSKAVVASNKFKENDYAEATVVLNEKELVLRAEAADMSAEEFSSAVSTIENIPAGFPVSFSGIMDSFGYGKAGNPQVKLRWSKDIKKIAVSNEELVNFAKEALTIKNCVNETESKIELPKTLNGFDGLTIEWKDESGIVSADGNITKPEKTTEVTITATLKAGDKSVTKDFSVTVCGKEQLTKVHTFDFEDAAPADKNGNSTTKPGYADGEIELGNPKAKWLLKNALISSTKYDNFDGKFGLRMQYHAKSGNPGRLELKTDFNFKYVDFSLAGYGGDTLDAQIVPSYSLDGGKTWKEGGKVYYPTSKSLETIRFVIPEEPTGTTRFALTQTSGKRINIDNVYLLK